MPRARCHFTGSGGIGAPVTVLHFPLPVLPPVTRPDASRWVPVNDPEGLPLVVGAAGEPSRGIAVLGVPGRASANPGVGAALHPATGVAVGGARRSSRSGLGGCCASQPAAESRYCVCALPPAFGLVVAVPMIRPEASRVVDCTVPAALFWRSMVWTIRPDVSRTTSRQVWAGDTRDKANESRAGRRRAFMVGGTEVGGWSFEQNAKIMPLSPSKIHHQKIQNFSTHPRYLSHPGW